MKQMNTFAIRGGKQVVTAKYPHVERPPLCKEDEKDAIVHTRNEHTYSKLGVVSEFKSLFLDYLGDQGLHGRYVSSIYEGLYRILDILDIGEGDEILCSSLIDVGFRDTIRRAGATYVGCDVSRETCNLDIETLKKNISHNTRVIIIPHQRGSPGPIKELGEYLQGDEIMIIEDCAHGYGGSIEGKMFGTFGDIALFSLSYDSLVFSGQGGFLVMRDKLLYDCLKMYGKNSEYEVEYIGPYTQFKGISPLHATVGKYSLRNMKHRLNGSRQCYAYFKERIKQVTYLSLFKREKQGVVCSDWYGFICMYDSTQLRKLSKQGLIKLLQAEGMNIVDGAAQYQHQDIKDGSNSQKILSELLILPHFYDWYKHKEIIDQYIAAFRKVQLNLFC